MLRETRAKWLASVTGLLLIAMAAGFAWLRNNTGAAQVAAATLAMPTVRQTAAKSASDSAAPGIQAFRRLGCAACHSLGGVGNPLRPLDGIGERLDRKALHDWATGEGDAQRLLPVSVVRQKSRATQDPDLQQVLDLLAHRP